MFVVREALAEDLDQILEVAHYLDSVNLPAKRTHLERLLECSRSSFAGSNPTSEREFLFVLEDTDNKCLAGTSIIQAQHGTKRSPHVFLQVLREERYSQTLDHYTVHQCLKLFYNYNGPTEIGGLILRPDYRGRPESLGKQLSYIRFLFIAMHRGVFRDQVLSELLPPLEPDGSSRLWRHFGRRFTGLTYGDADLLSKDNKEFIRALFPHELIYTSLFPEHVQEVIGQVGPATKGVEKMLRRIGFRYANQIDPFDGGPHFVAETDRISVVRDSRQVELVAADPGQIDSTTGRWSLVAVERNQAPHMRACAAQAVWSDGPSGAKVAVDQPLFSALGVEPGASAWAVVP